MNPETSLERALAADTAAATPLDALNAARDLWLAGERVDMGSLAARLGISRATLYRWVGTRERLLGEVAWTLADATMRHARADAVGSGPAYVADVIGRYLSAAYEFGPLRSFVENEPEYALRVLTSKHSPMQRRSIAATRDLLSEQVDAGALEPALDLDTMAFVIVRISESFLYNDIITGGEPDVRKAADAVHALLLAPPLPRHG